MSVGSAFKEKVYLRMYFFLFKTRSGVDLELVDNTLVLNCQVFSEVAVRLRV